MMIIATTTFNFSRSEYFTVMLFGASNKVFAVMQEKYIFAFLIRFGTKHMPHIVEANGVYGMDISRFNNFYLILGILCYMFAFVRLSTTLLISMFAGYYECTAG
ncbi:hypothetical protein GIB67_007114 [Kingdonia uniflora]|uniref:Uncharacterized protein n=1 Tax=Kingdonia uniflora TaxID=39325 RepID=A0A7J7MLG1_9MAGN|nr:hypothetical protein GIB67_007114 [Kingdonia uniflora]